MNIEKNDPQNSKINKSISRLTYKAHHHSWGAAHQLYEYYRDGKFVEQNYELATSYIQLAIDNIESQFISIEEMNFFNFRAFTDLTIKFPNENLLLIAGENGVGKSSILDGIYYSLSWLVNRIMHKGGKGKEIDILDIKDGALDGYSSIRMKLKLNKYAKINSELCELHIGSTANKKSYLVELSRIGSLYKLAGENNSDFTLPIFAYYGISRTIDISAKDTNVIDDFNLSSTNNRFEAYSNAFSGKADIKSFLKWFKRLDDIEKHRMASSDTVSEDDDLINKLSILATNDLNARKLLDTLKERNKKNNNENPLFEIKKIKEILNNAISNCMYGYSDLEIEIEPIVKLIISKNGSKLNILQLSQGEKSLLSLVLDIARRMIILNPNKEYPLHSPGIIIIDEIDLHLHPQWQRDIISNLCNVFVNCQFIASTHSPQIISEVKQNQVFILNSNTDGVIFSYNPNQSYGLTSNEILNELMSGDKKQLTRTPAVEYELKYIFELIDNGKITDAKIKISDLEAELNGDIPELLSAKMEIELREWDE